MSRKPKKQWPLIDSIEDVPVESLGELPRQCYEAIVESFQCRGIPPTHAELSSSMSVGESRIRTALRKLVSAGLIRREGRARGYRLITPNGCICPCCGGKGLIPSRKGNFGSPFGKRKVKEKVVFQMPNFVPPGLSLVGRTLKREEVELLTSLFTQFPGESPLMISRRFQEKTGRLLSNVTVKKYHRILISEGAVTVPPPRKDVKRGMKLTEAENDILSKLITSFPGEGHRKIARRFFEVTGRNIAKSTAQNLRKKLQGDAHDFPSDDARPGHPA